MKSTGRVLWPAGLSALGVAAMPTGCGCAASGDTSGFGGGEASYTTSAAVTGAGGLSVSGAGGGGPGGDPKTCDDAAEAKTYVGCDFWPTVVANNVWSLFDFAVAVANAGDETADVTVTRGGAMVASAEIPPNELRYLYLPWVPDLKGPDTDACGNAMQLEATVRSVGGAYHLVSTLPVTVYQFNALEYKGAGGPAGKSWAACLGNGACPSSGVPIGCFSFSNDASLLLPSTAMTNHYRVTGQKGWASFGIGPYVAITAMSDQTNVKMYLSPTAQVVPGGGIPGAPSGGTLSFTLNTGDVAQLVAPATADLSGSLITSDKPVQAIAGMPCTQSPEGMPACDHIEESVFPAETLGQHYFVTIPTGPNGLPVGHVVRIYGNVDGTTLTYPSGAPPGGPTTLHAGEVVDLGSVTKDFEIQGDQAFAVASFSLGASLVDPGQLPPNQKGDPDQSLATAVEQYRTKYIFLAPADYDVSFVDVIQPLDATVTIDGAAAIASATPIGSGFGIARVQLGPGNDGAHVLTASKPVGIQVMGYGAYTSYQYPGGLNLTAIAPPPDIPK